MSPDRQRSAGNTLFTPGPVYRALSSREGGPRGDVIACPKCSGILSDPSGSLRVETILIDLVRYGHLLAVTVGLGAAAMADMAVLTGARRGMSDATRVILEASHRMIWPALIGMWVTGVLLIGIRTGFAFSNVSPKLYAKLIVVTALTVNAFAIGRIGLGLMQRPGGMAGFSPLEARVAAIMGGVSGASWLLALALGSSRFLAEAPAPLFLLLLPLAYGTAIFGAERLILFLRQEPVAKPGAPHPVPAPDVEGVRHYRIGLRPRRVSRAA